MSNIYKNVGLDIDVRKQRLIRERMEKKMTLMNAVFGLVFAVFTVILWGMLFLFTGIRMKWHREENQTITKENIRTYAMIATTTVLMWGTATYLFWSAALA